MQTKEKIPILAVVGPTASGKTALGVELAKAYNGEVVSADSMQIYKGMDIATAKPTPEEMQGVPHHLIDILPRDTIFNVADYVKLAEQARKEPTQVKTMAVGWLLLSSYVTKSSVFQFRTLPPKLIWICPSMRTHACHTSRFGAIARIAMLSFGIFPA